MSTLLERLRSGAQVISVPTCRTVSDLERSVVSGSVLVHLENPKTYVGLYDTRLGAASAPERLTFTGWWRLAQREIACRVEVDRQTLQGWLSLCHSIQTGSGE